MGASQEVSKGQLKQGSGWTEWDGATGQRLRAGTLLCDSLAEFSRGCGKE